MFPEQEQVLVDWIKHLSSSGLFTQTRGQKRSTFDENIAVNEHPATTQHRLETSNPVFHSQFPITSMNSSAQPLMPPIHNQGNNHSLCRPSYSSSTYPINSHTSNTNQSINSYFLYYNAPSSSSNAVPYYMQYQSPRTISPYPQ
jgi:hypothetical protein